LARNVAKVPFDDQSKQSVAAFATANKRLVSLFAVYLEQILLSFLSFCANLTP
jgi:hypothetical protein